MMKAPLRSRLIQNRLSRESRCFLSSFSFTPTADVLKYQAHAEKSLQEQAEAIPHRPDLLSTKKIYREMVRPQDICDIFYRPSSTDYVVMALAREAPMMGDADYHPVTKSNIKASKLMFAPLALRWLDSIKSGIHELRPLPPHRAGLSYTNLKDDAAIEKYLSQASLGTYTDMQKCFLDLVEQGISQESVARFLLGHLHSLDDYANIMKTLSDRVQTLNPIYLKSFVEYLIEDLSRDSSLNRVEKFDSFFTDYLMPAHPKLVEDIDGLTLDKLAYICSFSSNLSSARQFLTILVQSHRRCPLNSTFELFMSRYSKLATQGGLQQERILQELAPLKPAIMSLPQAPGTIRFFIKTCIDNIHDLSNIVKVMTFTSEQSWREVGLAAISQLIAIQKKSADSNAIKALQLTQLIKTLKARGLNFDEESKRLVGERLAKLGFLFDYGDIL